MNLEGTTVVATPRHTPEQWRELVTRLVAVRDNIAETGARRARAASILEDISTTPEAQIALRQSQAATPLAPSVSDLSWQEMDF